MKDSLAGPRPKVPAALALKRELGSVEVNLINPEDITICKREDGSDWLLGAGSFGQVGQI